MSLCCVKCSQRKVRSQRKEVCLTESKQASSSPASATNSISLSSSILDQDEALYCVHGPPGQRLGSFMSPGPGRGISGLLGPSKQAWEEARGCVALGPLAVGHLGLVRFWYLFASKMGWDIWLFNLAWSLLFKGRVPYSGHNLQTHEVMKGQSNKDSNPVPPRHGSNQATELMRPAHRFQVRGEFPSRYP